MADLFVTIVAINPKPSTVSTAGPSSNNNSSPNNGTFTSIQSQQVQTPGK